MCLDFFSKSSNGTYPRKSKGSVSIGSAVIEINIEDTDAIEQELDEPPLLYKVSDAPPIYLTILFGLQVRAIWGKVG